MSSVRRLVRAVQAQDGSSPVTAVGSILMFLLFIFLSVQITLHLFATTRASGLALEAATRVARGDASCVEAESWVSQHIGGWNGVVPTCVITGDDRVRFEINGPSPAPVLNVFGRVTGFDTLVREASVRVERFR